MKRVALYGSLWALGCADPIYLMERMEVRSEDGWLSRGGGCMQVEGASSLGGGTSSAASTSAGDESNYEYSLSVANGTVELNIRVAGELVVERVFDRAFLESGEKEVFVTTEPNGVVHRDTFWGGADCEAPAEGAENAGERALQWAMKEDAGVAQ